MKLSTIIMEYLPPIWKSPGENTGTWVLPMGQKPTPISTSLFTASREEFRMFLMKGMSGL